MRTLRKGLAVALLHALIVCSLGAKLLYDRSHRPRVWVPVANYDPDLPIRGRYLSLNPVVPAEGISIEKVGSTSTDKYGKPVFWEHAVPDRCDLVWRGGVLTAQANSQGEYTVFLNGPPDHKRLVVAVYTQTPFFVPEHFDMQEIRASRELWMEASIPRKGPPRPIRLASKKNGVLVPFDIP